MKKKWIAWGVMSAMLLTGCGANNAEKVAEESRAGAESKTSAASGSAVDDSYSGSPEVMMEAEGAWDGAADAKWTGTDEMVAESTGSDGTYDVSTEAAMEESEPGSSGEDIEVILPVAGLLTAGEWCDNENWGFFTNLITTQRFNFQVFGLTPYERVVVQVVSDGTPVKQTPVELWGPQGAVYASAVTNHEGVAYLYYNVAGGEAEPYTVAVQAAGGVITAELAQAEVSVVTGAAETLQDGQQGDSWNNNYGVMNENASAIISYELTVEVPDYTAPVKQLDLMFVFDTTGSMGDELLYLQKEFQDIAERVADQSTRISVNFYRDEGDEYVVRSYPFMNDVQEVSELINAESANGGGDYEEAVDLALQEAVYAHDWNEDSVKLLFMILDAPPHDTRTVRENLASMVQEAARKGIRIIPIASSGVDANSEALLRDLAMITGGTYTFLTNDSGIGGSHLEPTIGSYEVEALNDLIVRLILEYYQ